MAVNHQLSTPKLQIGEVARQTELTVDAIRFYEKHRLLPKAMRTTGRFRLNRAYLPLPGGGTAVYGCSAPLTQIPNLTTVFACPYPSQNESSN
jgi:hypothetical protein